MTRDDWEFFGGMACAFAGGICIGIVIGAIVYGCVT